MAQYFGVEIGAEKMTRYDPHYYEPISFHIWFLFAVVCSLMVEIQKASPLDPFRTAILCLYVFSFPVIAMCVDFVEMCERRRFIEAFFPESYWLEVKQ